MFHLFDELSPGTEEEDFDSFFEEMLDDALEGFDRYLAAHDQMDSLGSA